MRRNSSFYVSIACFVFFLALVFWFCNASPAFASEPVPEPDMIESALSTTSPDSVIMEIQAIRANLDFVLYGLFPLCLAVFVIVKAARWFYHTFVDASL